MTSPSRTASAGRVAPFVLAAVTLGAALFLAWGARADDGAASKTVELRYISIIGDGPNARAWYNGAPPTGTAVQDALDTFAEQGFRVAEVTQSLITSATDASRWTILLERIR